MGLNATEYFAGLSAVLGGIRATDAGGADIAFDAAVDRTIDMMKGVAGAGGKVMLIGNGGSAGISSHMAVDIWKNGGIRATAFNDPSLLTCIGNDYGYAHIFEKPIEMFADRGDMLIAISSSGKSVNILNGVEAARRMDCPVVTLSGFGADNPLSRRGDVNFYVPSLAYGPVEVLHQALIHCFLDMYMVREGRLREGDFTVGR